jgi:PAS domain S-box-containing protein
LIFSSTRPQPTVLIVEDEAIVAEDLRNTVTSLGYRVAATVSTGEEALSSAQELRPDLVLLDIQIAGRLDGIETAQKIGLICNPAIIFVTAHSDRQTVQRVKDINCGYVLKPFGERELGIQLDIALYKNQTMKALQEKEERWQLAMMGSTDGIWDWNILKRTVFLSSRWKSFRGYSEDEISTEETEWSSRIHPDDYDTVMKTITSYLEKKSSEFQCEYRTRCKDGSYRWIIDRGIALWDSQGRPIRMVGSETDTTARKEAEAALESVALFPTQNPSPVLRIRAEGVLLYMNPAAIQLLGNLHLKAGKAVPPFLKDLVQQSLQSGRSVKVEHAIGSCHYFITITPIIKEHYANLYWTDITERKQAEEQSSRVQRTFFELVERAPFGIYIVDSRLRIVQMNAGSQTGTFRNVRPIIGRDFAEAMRILWPEQVATEIIAVFRRTLETGEPYYSPPFLKTRQDIEALEAYEWELHRLLLPDGHYGVICYYFDSTKLRDMEVAARRRSAQLEQLYELASAVNRADELHSLYDIALAAILSTLHADRASILLLDKSGVMRFHAWHELSQTYRSAVEGHSPWKAGQNDAAPIMVPDIALSDVVDSALRKTVLEEGIRSLAFIPLNYGAHLVGKFMVYFDQPHVMNVEDIEMALGIANTLATGIERKRAQEALHESEKRLAAEVGILQRLQELSTRLIHAGELHDLLREILSASADLTGTDKGNIQLLNPTTGHLRIVSHQGLGKRFVEHFAEHGWVATCDAAMQQAQRVIVEDVANEPSVQGTVELEIVLEDGIRAIQSTPLIGRDGRFLGMLNNHFRSVHRPSESDLRCLDLLARMAADLIERAEAEKSLRDREAQLASEAAALVRLNELTSRLWRTDVLQEGLNEMLAATMELLGANMGNIRLLDPARRVLTVEVQRGFEQDFLEFFREISAEDNSACGRALRSSERIVIEDVETDAFYAPLRAIARASGYRAVQSTPLLGRDGKPLGMLSTHWRSPHQPSEQDLRRLDLYLRQATDFIERSRTDTSLRNRADQFETLLNQAPLGVYLVDADFRIAQVNPVARPVFGDIPNLIGRDFGEVIQILWEKRYADEIVGIFRRTLETGEPYANSHSDEYRIDRNHREHYEWRVDRIVLPDGGFGVVCYFRDISAQVQAQDRIRESEARFRTMADVSPVIIWVSDANGGIEFINQAYRNFCGVTDDDVRERRWQMVVHPDDREQYVSEFLRCVRNKEPFYARCRIKRADGEWRWIASYGAPRFSKDGQFLGHVGSSPDVQDLQEAQERLQRWNIELEEAVNIQTVELRKSQERLRALTTELNLAEQRERKRLATELHDHLQQMLVLAKLKLGQGKKTADSFPKSLKVFQETDDVLSEALQYTRTLVADLSPPVLRDHGLAAGLRWLANYMRKHDMSVKVSAPEGDSVSLPDDQRALVFQSVRELLINSCKHAGTGQASVSMEITQGRLKIEVTDEGKGFDFTAAEEPAGGLSSGFGLFSIQERMRALGGGLEIHSAPGHGTVAILSLPIVDGRPTADKASKASIVSVSDLTGLPTIPKRCDDSAIVRVVLVDDHRMMRQGLRSVLEGYEDIEVVGEAADGEEAITVVTRLQPDAVVMDINMPKKNGIEATREIKARHPETTVIGLSVNSSIDDEEVMINAGAALLLNKEAAVEHLCSAIRKAVKVNGSLSSDS